MGLSCYVCVSDEKGRGTPRFGPFREGRGKARRGPVVRIGVRGVRVAVVVVVGKSGRGGRGGVEKGTGDARTR